MLAAPGRAEQARTSARNHEKVVRGADGLVREGCPAGSVRTVAAKTAETIAGIAASMQSDTAELSRRLADRLQLEIPELGGEQGLIELFAAGAHENVRGALHAMEAGIDKAEITTPPAALEYARRIAQRGIPISALLRALRLGQAEFQQELLNRMAGADLPAHLFADVARQLTVLTFGYIDQVSEESVNVYQQERENWLRNRVAARAARVRSVLAGKPLDAPEAERLLGYRFEQRHVGVIVWTDITEPASDQLSALERVATRLAARVGVRRAPLLVAVDDSTLWAWLPAPTLALDDVAATFAAEVDDAVRVAAGEPATGLDGFRRTHRQARQAQVVARAARLPNSPRVVLSVQIGPVALMCEDLDATAAWVRTTLGDLALDDEPHARLRETLWAFLSSGCSFTAAAQQLILHKNTVQYRVRKAEEALGHSVKEHRLDLELALLVCRGLGSTVLVPAGNER